MNIRIAIQVITVISSEALISYQQVYVNNDFERQTNMHKDLLLQGWTVSRKSF